MRSGPAWRERTQAAGTETVGCALRHCATIWPAGCRLKQPLSRRPEAGRALAETDGQQDGGRSQSGEAEGLFDAEQGYAAQQQGRADHAATLAPSSAIETARP